jgi:apolipoprotein N-acyltransferase
MIFGADDVESHRRLDGEEGHDLFNAAFLLAPDGSYRERYRKRRLVIFGEYVPLAEWLPFVKHLTPIQTGRFSSVRSAG